MTLLRLLIFPAILILASCSNVFYENPQPAGISNLTEFPKKLTGFYLDAEKGDSLVNIFSGGFSLKVNSNDVKIPLGEKTILRKYKDYYFLNLWQESDSLWTVYIVKPGKKKSLVLYDFSPEGNISLKLKEITSVKQRIKSDKETPALVINPSIEEIDKLLKSGLLVPSINMKK